MATQKSGRRSGRGDFRSSAAKEIPRAAVAYARVQSKINLGMTLLYAFPFLAVAGLLIWYGIYSKDAMGWVVGLIILFIVLFSVVRSVVQYKVTHSSTPYAAAAGGAMFLRDAQGGIGAGARGARIGLDLGAVNDMGDLVGGIGDMFGNK
jgi:uncharacterized membrane protein